MSSPQRPPTECPCCFETYTMDGVYQPRMVIPCGHTVCFTCINKLASQPSLTCPICRKRCPSRFINETGFPINYLAISLLENQKKLYRNSMEVESQSSVSDSCSSPCLKRKENIKSNECTECKVKTDNLLYCFHCASPVCRNCKLAHVDSLIAGIEKRCLKLQDHKSEAVKKIEEIEKLIEDLQGSSFEAETAIEDSFTLITHEIQEAKSRLMECLNEAYDKEQSALKEKCSSITDALEKAGTNDGVSDLIAEKNAEDMSGTDIANLCELAMNVEVISKNLSSSLQSTLLRETKFKFSDQDQLIPIRSLIQRFGKIKVSHRINGGHWVNQDEENTHRGTKPDASLLSRKQSFESAGSETDGESTSPLDPCQRRQSHSISTASSSSYLTGGNDCVAANEPVPSTRKFLGKKSPLAASGAKAKVRNKLRGTYTHSSMMRSASMSRLDSFSDADTMGNLSDTGSAPYKNQYATLKDRYENICGPVGSLKYRDHSSCVMDIVARYRSNGIVVADNDEFLIKAYSGNHILSITFSFQLLHEDTIPFISGVATTSERNFILVDSKNKIVRLFDRYGTHLCDMGRDMFQRPRDVCTDNTEIFVTDSGGSCIQVFDMNGAHLRTIGCPGSGDCEFLWPSGMKMTSEGKLVICDVNNNRIQIITKDGEHVQSISCVYGAYSCLKPTCVDVDRDNNIVALFGENRRVKIFNSDGNTIMDFRIEDELTSIAVCSDGLIALIDGTKNGKCLLY